MTTLPPYAEPSWPTRAWSQAELAALGLDPVALARLDTAARSATPHVQSLLIARHGVLAFEAYYHGVQIGSYQSVSSITKSVVSALIGVALQRGLLSSLDQPVYDFFPEYAAAVREDPRKRDITLRHLLGMTAGYADKLPDDFYINVVRSALERPLMHTPGAQFRYDSQGVDVLSAVLTRVTGQPAAFFAHQTVFASLGIWQRDDVRFLWRSGVGGPHMWHADGLWSETHGLPWKANGQGDSTGGFGAHFTARELAKLGLLYLAGGSWAGERLLPDSFVRTSTSQQSAGGWPEHTAYGYLWWVDRRAGSQEAVQASAYYASGYGGKYLYVVPSLDLVIVLLSTSEQGPGETQRDLMTTLILPAVTPDC